MAGGGGAVGSGWRGGPKWGLLDLRGSGSSLRGWIIVSCRGRKVEVRGQRSDTCMEHVTSQRPPTCFCWSKIMEVVTFLEESKRQPMSSNFRSDSEPPEPPEAPEPRRG